MARAATVFKRGFFLLCQDLPCASPQLHWTREKDARLNRNVHAAGLYEVLALFYSFRSFRAARLIFTAASSLADFSFALISCRLYLIMEM